MIRYILVDDNQQVAERVKVKIDMLPKDYGLKHVATYVSSTKAYKEVNEIDYDLLVVDFEMPVYNGIELARKIATAKKIIFLTSTSNNEKLIINSLDIAGYMSKPFDIEEFAQILKHKVIGKIHSTKVRNQNERITIHIGANKDLQFLPDELYYISTSRINGKQPDKNCVHLYGKNDKILFDNVRKSISELYELLSDYDFEKISQGTIINLKHIKERDNMNLSLYDCQRPFEVTAKEKVGLVRKIRAKFGI